MVEGRIQSTRGGGSGKRGRGKRRDRKGVEGRGQGRVKMIQLSNYMNGIDNDGMMAEGDM